MNVFEPKGVAPDKALEQLTLYLGNDFNELLTMNTKKFFPET